MTASVILLCTVLLVIFNKFTSVIVPIHLLNNNYYGFENIKWNYLDMTYYDLVYSININCCGGFFLTAIDMIR